MKRFRWNMPHSFSRKEAVARIKGGIEIAENEFEGAISNYDNRWKNGFWFRFTYQLDFNYPLVKKAIRLVRWVTRGLIPIPDCLKVAGVLFISDSQVRIVTTPLALHEKITFLVFPVAKRHLDRRALEVLS